MTEAEWLNATNPHHLLWQLSSDGPSSRRVLLLGITCCRLIHQHLIAPQSQAALVGLEQLADSPGQNKNRRTIGRQALRGFHWARQVSERYRTPAMAVCILAGLDQLNTFDNVLFYLRQVAEADGQIITFDRQSVAFIRDIFGNPFRPISFDSTWRTSTAIAIAQQMYDSRDFSAIPILADALQDAGCDNDDVLTHCRAVDGVHVRGCWVVDLVLGKA